MTGLRNDDLRAAALFALAFALLLVSSRFAQGARLWDQALAILALSSFVVIVAFGQHFVVLLGGLDLAVASVMTLGGILIFGWAQASPSALLWAVPAVLLITALIGALSGAGVSLVRIPPFIMTLAMGIIIASAVLGITQGVPHGAASPVLSALFTASWLGVPRVIVLTIALTALGTLVERRTVLGRRIYAIGANREAAHLAGLPVNTVTVLCYAISGAASGLAGILMVGYASGATLELGQSYLLPSIAAVIVGGTSIAGGRGTLLGVAGGAVLLTTLSATISALAIAEGWRIVIYGFVILAALLLLRGELYGSIRARITHTRNLERNPA
ncbi:MAG TPA: ABC transporter permease [Candidatus Elarobacter sp.]|jgi:ribose transport system permease protein|nr:ABC transporter permease [Candidatus Elarobacter sp.]